jgi:hypothetical protein
MQKIFLVFLVIVLCQSSSAQDNPREPLKQNLIKLNVPALLFKSFSVQYERAIAKKTALALTVRYLPEGAIPFKSSIKDLIDDPATERQIDNVKVGNFAIMPEARFYLGRKGVFRGFYLGPFAGFASYNMEHEFEYTESNTTKTIPLKGKAQSYTGGLMIGAQWKLNRSLFLDWWIAGVNYGLLKGDVKGQKTLTLSEQDALRQALQDLDLPFVKYTYEVDNNGATIYFDGPWAGVRAGICIGISF